jgi:hypothetical protein
MRRIIILIVSALTLFCIPNQTLAKKSKTPAMKAYLFTYFPGNRPEQEQIHFAISQDGFNYTPLNNGNPVIGSDSIAVKKGVRDPHILRGPDNTFYMVVTDMRCADGWNSNRGIVLLHSKDLVHWTHHAINFPTRYAGTMFANVTRVWAPQTIYDKKAKKYMVYFSIFTNDGQCPYDRVYWAYANKDFTDLEGEPRILFDRGRCTIDTDIIQDSKGLYHIFFKTEGEKTKGILQYTAKDLHNETLWTRSNQYCQQTKEQVEGAGVFPLIGGGWVLMYDCYTNGHYQFCTSPDLKTFTFKCNTELKGKFTPRHGTVLQITDAELQRLQAAFPSNN